MKFLIVIFFSLPCFAEFLVKTINSPKFFFDRVCFSKDKIYQKFYFTDDFVGKIPEKLGHITMQLQNATACVLNRAILYGPSGNGKSTLVKKMAETADCELIHVLTPNIVSANINREVSEIDNIFKDAQSIYSSTGKRVIIFFDEVDALVACDNKEANVIEALQALWLKLDEFKECPHIYIICATNKLDKLPATFLDRFTGNLIEVKNPGLKKRKKILGYYFSKRGKKLAEDLLLKIAKACKGFSIRLIKDLVDNIVWNANRFNGNIVTDIIVWKEYYIVLENMNNSLWKKCVQFLKSKALTLFTITSICSAMTFVAYKLRQHTIIKRNKRTLKEQLRQQAAQQAALRKAIDAQGREEDIAWYIIGSVATLANPAALLFFIPYSALRQLNRLYNPEQKLREVKKEEPGRIPIAPYF